MKTATKTIFHRFGLIDRQSTNWIISLLIISLLILPFSFMTIKGSFGILSAICLLLSIFALLSKVESKSFFKANYFALIIICLTSGPLSILLTQMIGGSFSAPAFDGPIRLFAALIVLIAIYKHRIDFSRIISLSIPLALLFIFIYAKYSNHLYGDRLTNDYLDPIIWGNFSIILGFISFASIHSKDHYFFKVYKLTGLILGVSMSVLSQSRSGWIAAVIMILVWLAINRKKFTPVIVLSYLSTLIAILFFLYFFIDSFKLRIDIAISDIINWTQNPKEPSSASIRLNMLKISSHIFFLSPWFGFGEFSKLPLENNIYVLSIGDPGAAFTLQCCGPHNDFAAHALKYGFFGIIYYFSKFFIPVYIFFKLKHHESAVMGMVLSVGFIVCGFFSEMQTLKFSYTFYGVFISGLIATTLWKETKSL